MTDLVRTDVPPDFGKQMEMARVYATSTLLPSHLRGKPENVLVILAGARSLNVSAFWALQSMHVIEGKLSLSAELMRGLAIRAGHRVRILKRELDEAIVEIQRADRDEPYQASFTWKEAVDAKLDQKENWKKYRRAMLVARATSIAMRDECPDVLYGVVYTPDELGANEAEDGSISDLPAEEVPPMGDEELAAFLAKVATADSTSLIAFSREASDRGVLDRPAGSGTVRAEIVLRVKYLTDAEDVTQADIRNLYKVTSGLGMLDELVAAVPRDGAEPEPMAWRLAFALKSKIIQEEADRLANAAEDDIQDAQVIEDEKPDVQVDTEHAQRLREEAAASWENS